MDRDALGALFALVGLLAFGAVGFGWRVWLQYRWTGDTGLRVLPRTPAEWVGGVALVSGVVAGVLAPIGELAGGMARFEALVNPVVRTSGMLALVAGFLLTIRAQLEMGESWRVGVDEKEMTALVTRGTFRLVRNPIYSGMIVVFTGVALLVPSVPAWVGLVLVVVGLEIQVRLVEEPYLARLHGNRYLDYASTVGRFVPGVGRLARP